MDRLPAGRQRRFDVFVVPSSGGAPQQVTRENGSINGFSWLPDSTGILYSAGRGNTMAYLASPGLWRIAPAAAYGR